MWADHALPRLHSRGLGVDVAVRTYRLMGIGESLAAEILGEELLRRPNPEVATYARVEAVDVRISAVGGSDGAGGTRTAESLVEEAAAIVTHRLADHVWGRDDQTWADAIGKRLTELGWRLGFVELVPAGRWVPSSVTWTGSRSRKPAPTPVPGPETQRASRMIRPSWIWRGVSGNAPARRWGSRSGHASAELTRP